MSGAWLNTVHLGSSESMAQIPQSVIDALVTDPPAGIAFMGKAWDAHASRQHFIDELRPIFVECLRVMKPGAHGFVWALPRTSHWTMTALEDAGFEIRDVVVHLFGSGFPKSLDVSKAIDKGAGAEREVISEGKAVKRMIPGADQDATGSWIKDNGREFVPTSTAPATENARRWNGWGTALKPASEHWILIRKPLSEKNVAANVLRYGTGALNIDASRIDGVVGDRTGAPPLNRIGSANHRPFHDRADASVVRSYTAGRWPANVVLSHNDDCELIGTRTVRGDGRDNNVPGKRGNDFVDVGAPAGDSRPGGPLYPDEEIPVYRCSDGCAVAALDAQSGTLKSGAVTGDRPATMGYTGTTQESPWETYADVGGASRFFYVAKPPSIEKNAMTGDGKNTHPTVKPVDLMCHLIRMITPPGGIVLDPFAGSGTTLVAAESMGFRWVGYEREAEYRDIALARLSQRSLFGDGVA